MLVRFSAEVAVDLEGRMGVEQVVAGGIGQQPPQVPHRALRVAQTGVQGNQPCAAPAGVTAAV